MQLDLPDLLVKSASILVLSGLRYFLSKSQIPFLTQFLLNLILTLSMSVYFVSSDWLAHSFPLHHFLSSLAIDLIFFEFELLFQSNILRLLCWLYLFIEVLPQLLDLLVILFLVKFIFLHSLLCFLSSQGSFYFSPSLLLLFLYIPLIFRLLLNYLHL